LIELPNYLTIGSVENFQKLDGIWILFLWSASMMTLSPDEAALLKSILTRLRAIKVRFFHPKLKKISLPSKLAIAQKPWMQLRHF
jgi:hypothetical protein